VKPPVLLLSCLVLLPAAAQHSEPAAAQQSEPAAHPKLLSTLWVQTSEEWRGLTAQAYRQAAAILDRALKNKKWTAALEQQPGYGKLPPAVILDIDETVLDNSPSQAREVKQGRTFDPVSWDKWVQEGVASAIPGAAEFCRYAASRKVTVYFVTNREASQEQATRSNLARLGFPLAGGQDTVLCRGEMANWGSDKGTRRAQIAARHRVLLLLGDDLGDFISGARTSVVNRRKLTEPHLDKWGEKWILLPNPSYGSWEEALYGERRPAGAAERLAREWEYLRTQ
jgi:5'-nucleotidase (lipoprotein e(P4) family)